MKLKIFLSCILTTVYLNGCSSHLKAPVPSLALNTQTKHSLLKMNNARFTRSPEGIITDSKTGLEWLEGPDIPTSWEMAKHWVDSLGEGWRLPSTKQLHSLYLKDSTRKGKYGDPLGLDKVFLRESGYSLWSIKRSSNSAWMYDFSRGYYHWTEIVVKGHFDRAIAVRKKS